MSFLVWVTWRIQGRPSVVRDSAHRSGIVGAALLFAMAHLLILFAAQGSPTASTIAVVIGGNFIGGLAFGWLFWRRGLEAAMIAHIGAHLIAAALSAVLAHSA